VAAARQQAQERGLERVGLEVEGRHVALEVIDRHEREAGGPTRSPWRRRRRPEAHRSVPGRRHADDLHVRKLGSRLPERLPDDRRERARGAAATRPPARPRRSGRGGRPATRRTLERIRPSRVTSAAAVSSQDVSIPRIMRFRRAKALTVDLRGNASTARPLLLDEIVRDITGPTQSRSLIRLIVANQAGAPPSWYLV